MAAVSLREALASDSVASVHGILNGTCNYILTRMREGMSFATALKQAQELAMPRQTRRSTWGGHDAAPKAGVMAMLAFGASVNAADIMVEGISEIEEVDLQFADRFGYRIKHLGIGYDRGERVELRVHPALVGKIACSPMSTAC